MNGNTGSRRHSVTLVENININIDIIIFIFHIQLIVCFTSFILGFAKLILKLFVSLYKNIYKFLTNV